MRLNVKTLLQATILFSLIILPLNFYAWGLTSTEVVLRANTGVVNYGSSGAALRFKSGFEYPVTLIGGTPPTSISGMDISPFDWSTLYHEFGYAGGVSYVTSAIDNFASPRDGLAPTSAHSGGTGTRCLYQELRGGGSNTYRNELEIKTADNTDYASGRIQDLPKLYLSTWWFFPSNFDLNSGGWMGLVSWREFGNTGATQAYDYSGASIADEFSVALYIYRDKSGLYWYIHANHYQGNGSPFSPRTWEIGNHDVPVPRGRWFHLEIYEERAVEHGVVKVWIDGTLVFDISDSHPPSQMPFGIIRTSLGNHKTRLYVSKIYSDSTSASGHYPLRMWSDDIEIWDDIPGS